MKKSLILIMALAMTGLFLAAAQAQVNASGDWTFTMSTPRGDRTSDATFVQDGEKLTVTMKGQRGESTGQGTVKGQDIESDDHPRDSPGPIHRHLQGQDRR